MNFRDSAEFIEVEAELNHLERIFKYEKNDNPGDLNLEDFLAILRIHNIIIGNFMRKTGLSLTHDKRDTDNMPGFEFAYDLFEKISESLNGYRFTDRSEESICEEIFSCLFTYVEMTAICGRNDWYDVNKRAAGLMISTLLRNDYLVERLEENIKNNGWTRQFSQTRFHYESEDSWILEFLNAVLKQYKEIEKAN